MPETALTILAIDPSTEITGVAIVRYTVVKSPSAWSSAEGGPGLTQWAAFNACHIGRVTDLTSRLKRISWTRQRLLSFVGDWCGAIDLVAYETDTERGHAASEALKMATGAFLTIYPLVGIPVVAITRQAACKASGTLSVYRQSAGKTSAEKKAKKRRMKLAVIEWANRPDTFDAGLREDQDAIADALAVAQAAWDRERTMQEQQEVEARQPRLTGPRGGKL